MIFISIFSKIKLKDKAFNKKLNDNGLSHYLVKYDLLEYNFKDIERSFGISYIAKQDSLEDNLVIADDLKSYESIEESTSNKISVLIRKFKLRITFIKNGNLSEEIVICEDHDFELDSLRHTDSLIKIAIVKDDVDNWVNGGKLTDYDIIFTTEKEYIGTLKEVHENVFRIADDCKYLQFKNILNFLYKRKNQKFHHSIGTYFNTVFPKYYGYFKVFDSKYFDEEWYKDEYDLYDNTDPVVHFLLVGGKKGYDPSPDFSTREYFECNRDVELKGVNPLLHYESYGIREGRIIHSSDLPKRDYSLILNSSYLDNEWYKNTYDISEDIDCAEHYLYEGYLKSFNPGPNFNTYEYLECNNDVRRIGMNPLLHYELYGIKENRRKFLLDDMTQKNYDFVSNSPYFDEVWYKNQYDIPDDVDCVNHYLKIGFAKLYDPSNDFSTSEYFECNPDVRDHLMNPLLHYEKYGRNENRRIHL